MPFKIKIKGQTIEARPFEPVEEGDEERLRRLGHAGYLAFDGFCVMTESRNRAILTWEKRERLGAEMDHRDPMHPKYGSALNKMGEYEGTIVVNQVRFLRAERDADDAWQQMSESERKEEGVADMFNVEPNARHLLGLWHHEFPTAYTPDVTFSILATSILASPPSQQQVYIRLRFGRDDRYEDS